MSEIELGRVTHYFSHEGVAAVEIVRDHIEIGDVIHVKGHTSDFTQQVEAMDSGGQPVREAHVGQSVGIHTDENARVHDVVYKIVP
ncbi:MAG: translation elongation factor-like protein [Planctomycetota bacterium]